MFETSIRKYLTGWILMDANGQILCRSAVKDGMQAVTDASGLPLLSAALNGSRAEIRQHGTVTHGQVLSESYAYAALPDRICSIRLESGLALQRVPGGWSILLDGTDCGSVRFGLMAHSLSLREEHRTLAPMIFALLQAAAEAEAVTIV